MVFCMKTHEQESPARNGRPDTQKISPLKRAVRAAGWLAHALIFPFSFDWKEKVPTANVKKVGVYLLSWFLIAPSGLMLFPKAQRVLEEKGVDPAIVEQLAPGKDIRVIREDANGFLGKIAMMSANTVPMWWPKFYFDRMAEGSNVAGYTSPDFSMIFNDTCAIYLQSSERRKDSMASIDKSVREKSGGRYGFEALLDTEDRELQVLLHEIRHCGDDNQSLPHGVLKEGDADYHSAVALAYLRDNPELAYDVALNNAFSGGDAAHDTVLYIDAMLNGVPVPSQDRIDAANAEAAPMIETMMMLKVAQISNECAENAKELCSYKTDLSSFTPLARRRIELNTEALDRVFKQVGPAPVPGI